MKGSIEHTRVAINTMRARLTILGFNLAIISRILLAGDLLMYLALAQTVSGFFSSYERVLEVLLISTEAEQGALATIQMGIAIVGSTVWAIVIYVGPMVSLARSSHTRFTKLLHSAGYFGILIFISRLWWAAQRIEGRTIAGDGSQTAWFNAFVAPLYW